MAALKQPHYVFESGLSTGIFYIPAGSLISTKNDGMLFVLTDKTGLISSSTVTDAEQINANEKFGKSLAGPQGPIGPQGPDGPQGNQGAQGISGPTGAQGLQGVQGSQGLTGQAGTKGDTGTTGPQGPSGPTGSQGSTGPQGGQGATGPQGLEGEQGIEGAQGAGTEVQGSDTIVQIKTKANVAGHMWISTTAGVDDLGNTVLVGDGIVSAGSDWITVGPMQGPAGAQGPAGIQGEQGIEGPLGPQGDEGIQGSAGAQGVQGEIGPTGGTGLQGIQGDPGPQGVSGTAGADGSDGAQGIQGIQGEQGTQGNDGIQGETGPTGAKGDVGDEGKVGRSAYEEAVIGGYTGTETEWVASLKGDTGLTGPTGPVSTVPGPTGADGDEGPQGIQGSKGDQGDTGPAGSDATVEFASQVEVDEGVNSSKVISPKTLKDSSKWSTYMPKSGGVFTGKISLPTGNSGSNAIRVDEVDSKLGGYLPLENDTKGWIMKEEPDGSAKLGYYNSGWKNALYMGLDELQYASADGALRNVVTVDGPEDHAISGGTGWVKFPDGTLINYGSTSGGSRATFIKSFIAVPYVQVTVINTSGNSGVDRLASSYNATNYGVDIHVGTISGGASSAAARWTAMGRWK